MRSTALTLPAVLALALLLAGCGLSQAYRGQYYLNSGQYAAGVAAFQEEARAHPGSSAARYYLGRLLLAQDRAAEALPHLQEAARLAPRDADCRFWTGVAQGVLGQHDAERASYLAVLALDPRRGDALTYLGHNLLEQGDVAGALARYQAALEVWPGNTAALHNRALCLDRLGRTTEAVPGYREFLDRAPYGALARSVAERLNALGDFTWRNHLVGRRTLTLRDIRFTPGAADLRPESGPSLDHLATVAANMPGVVLHVLVYQQGDPGLAEARARSVHSRLLASRPELAPRVRLSWFGTPEAVRAGERAVSLPESVAFFTLPPSGAGRSAT